jgi:hypothetical protein
MLGEQNDTVDVLPASCTVEQVGVRRSGRLDDIEVGPRRVERGLQGNGIQGR